MSSIQRPELSPQIERRPERRRRTLLGGCIAFDGGRQVFDCTIRNLSKGGARITLPIGQTIPKNIFLIQLRDRLVCEAAIVWRKDGEAGLSFARIMQLSELTDSKLAYLQTVWFERAARR